MPTQYDKTGQRLLLVALPKHAAVLPQATPTLTNVHNQLHAALMTPVPPGRRPLRLKLARMKAMRARPYANDAFFVTDQLTIGHWWTLHKSATSKQSEENYNTT